MFLVFSGPASTVMCSSSCAGGRPQKFPATVIWSQLGSGVPGKSQAAIGTWKKVIKNMCIDVYIHVYIYIYLFISLDI